MTAPAKTRVLFDLGNVLVHLDLERGLEHLRRLVGDAAPGSLDEAQIFFSEMALATNRGTLAPDRFLARLGRLLGAPGIKPGLLAEAWCDIFTPWPEMEALADEVLRAGHPAYLLSNTDPLHFAFLSMQMPVLGRLTGLYLSYEAGQLKPEPAYFEGALRRFQLSAADCVFIDDRAEHVAAARALGITALQHTGQVAPVRAFLRERGVALGPP